jgi:hypothetical protein
VRRRGERSGREAREPTWWDLVERRGSRVSPAYRRGGGWDFEPGSDSAPAQRIASELCDSDCGRRRVTRVVGSRSFASRQLLPRPLASSLPWQRRPVGEISGAMTTMTRQLGRLYTPLPLAIAQLNGAVGTPNGNGSRFPVSVPPGRYAVFARQVATPSHKVSRFLSLASANGLTPLFFEFHADKFVTRNRCKFALAKMRFADEPSTWFNSPRLTVVDVQSAQGRPLDSIRTLWGEPLVDFHHGLLFSVFERLSCSAVFFDGSAWFRSHGSSAHSYYESFLSLFVSGWVLFESYLLQPDELAFTRDVVMPAFHSVRAAVGRSPLVVRLDPPELEGSEFWLAYPTAIAPRCG